MKAIKIEAFKKTAIIFVTDGFNPSPDLLLIISKALVERIAESGHISRGVISEIMLDRIESYMHDHPGNPVTAQQLVEAACCIEEGYSTGQIAKFKAAIALAESIK